MKNILLPLLTMLFTVFSAEAQLVIDNATFFIGENAVVTVQGDLTTNVNIQAGGAAATQGKIQMKGSSLQTIAAGGNLIPRLEIDNASHVQLTQDLRVENRIDLLNGRLRTFNNNLILPATITVVGMNASRFIETNGTGAVRQLVPANVASLRMVPIGNGANYTPIEFTSTGATYAAGAFIAFRATGIAVPTPTRHPRTESFLTNSWVVTKSGVAGGTQNVEGTYTNVQITGTEADIRGMFWNGTTWSRTGGGQNAANNMVATSVPGTTGTLYGMNTFLLASPTVFLQGPYDAGTGLMRDLLRSTDLSQIPGNPSSNNIIPTSDPYRTADYSSNFVHVNNTTVETIAASVLNHQTSPENNVVDWVFVQLRKATGPSNAAVAQTRSALLRRDGKIVDIDGVSPLYFKNEDVASNYVLTIRHRNHLSISVNPSNPLALNLSNTNFDFTSPTNNASIMGTSGTHFTVTNLRNIIWGGNTSGNGFTRYVGANGPGASNQSDRDAIILDLGGTASQVFSNLYKKGDINMNRITRAIGNNGPGVVNLGDGNVLLNVLSTSQTDVRSQILPSN